MAAFGTFRQGLSLLHNPRALTHRLLNFSSSSLYSIFPRTATLAHQRRLLSWTVSRPNATSNTASSSPLRNGPQEQQPQTELQFKTEPRLQITFTCTVKDCGTRSSHEFSKKSYTTGIVIVECPGCKNRHLIADHIGWFKEITQDGKAKTVEDFVKAKGEKVRLGRIDGAGTIEYAPE